MNTALTPDERAHARREHHERRMLHRDLLEVIYKK